MKKPKTIPNMILLSICLSILAGCDRSAKEKQEALVEAEKAKAQLAKVNALLEQARSERDQLQERVAKVLEELQNTKVQLANAGQGKEQLQSQISELTRQRDAAIVQASKAAAEIEGLKAQLKETVELLRAQPGKKEEQPVKEPSEDQTEEPNVEGAG